MSDWSPPGSPMPAGERAWRPLPGPRDGRGQREPALVALPRSRVATDARLVRLRLPDRPGSLAAIAGHLAAHGLNVLRLEVLDRESGWVVDDFLVAGADVGPALDRLAAGVEVLACRPGVDLRDPGLAMAAACASVTAASSEREAHRALVRAALELVFGEAAFLCLRQGHGFLRPVASTVPGLPVIDDGAAALLTSALFSGEPLTADGRVPWAPERYRDLLPGGAVAVVPGGEPPSLLLVVLRDDLTPFVAAELDRLAALVRVAEGTLRLHEAARGVDRGRSAAVELSR